MGPSPPTCHPSHGGVDGWTELHATYGQSLECLPRPHRLNPIDTVEEHCSCARFTAKGLGPPESLPGAPSALTHALFQSQQLMTWCFNFFYRFKYH